MRLLFFSSVLLVGLTAALSSSAQDAPIEPTAGLRKPPVIYLDVNTSTWRTRGRVSFALTPALKSKLTSAGFAVTQDPETPRDLILTVDYREERGKPISLGLSGTEITCLVALDDPRRGRLLATRIHESPSYAELVTAPYVEVVEKLQENPYFYFLGDLIRGSVEDHLDLPGALVQALAHRFERQLHQRVPTPFDTLLSPAETFPDLDLYYASRAWENAIEELGRLKESRAIPVLERLMLHSDRRIRLRAILALGEFDVPSVAAAMTRILETEADAGVRDAAQAVLARPAAR